MKLTPNSSLSGFCTHLPFPFKPLAKRERSEERDPISLVAKSFPTSNCASSTKSCSGYTTSMIYLRLFFPFPTLENCQWRHVSSPGGVNFYGDQISKMLQLLCFTLVLVSESQKSNKRKDEDTDLGKVNGGG